MRGLPSGEAENTWGGWQLFSILVAYTADWHVWKCNFSFDSTLASKMLPRKYTQRFSDALIYYVHMAIYDYIWHVFFDQRRLKHQWHEQSIYQLKTKMLRTQILLDEDARCVGYEQTIHVIPCRVTMYRERQKKLEYVTEMGTSSNSFWTACRFHQICIIIYIVSCLFLSTWYELTYYD